ncbi:MAG: alkaline phosphatase family protein [Bryobacteraceae bacterium]
MKQLFRHACGVLAAAVLAAATDAPRPKLVLAIMVDQFRYDYLTRFRSAYTAGFDRLLREGAVFTNAYYEHFPTVTAIGHSTFLTGATPSISGIVGNEWYDRELRRQVTSVFDPAAQTLDASGKEAASPRRLMVSTIGDELKMAGRGANKVIGISFKDRSAILPVGRMADAAYWFDTHTGNFVTSTYYMSALPAWVRRVNDGRASNRYAGLEWRSIEKPDTPAFRIMAPAGPELYATLQKSPFANELILHLAEQAIEAEHLGRHAETDVLAVSLSANDYIGHEVGPDDPRVRDISIRTDRLLGRLMDFAESRAGKGNVLLVLTADHGVSPLPELMQKRRMPGGRLAEDLVVKTLEQALSAIYGEGPWVVGKSGPSPYLNHELIGRKKLELAGVRRRAAEIVRGIPHVARVYTLDQLLEGRTPDDQVDRRVLRGIYPPRAADLYFVTEPYWMFEDEGTTHGSPYGYDAHVPVIFHGGAIRAGRHHRKVAVNDIAPTLATLLEIEPPAGSVGQVLTEVFSTR